MHYILKTNLEQLIQGQTGTNFAIIVKPNNIDLSSFLYHPQIIQPQTLASNPQKITPNHQYPETQ